MKIPDYNKKIKHPTYLKMQDEIKRLKEEYIMLQNASDEVEEEKDKEIERLNSIIKEVRELLSQEWYTVLRKRTIRQVLEILDKEKE